MINYNTSKPNARFWVLKMIKDNIRPGNKRNKPPSLKLQAEWKGARTLSVDPSSNDGPPLESTLTDAQTALEPFEVKLIILPSP